MVEKKNNTAVEDFSVAVRIFPWSFYLTFGGTRLERFQNMYSEDTNINVEHTFQFALDTFGQ